MTLLFSWRARLFAEALGTALLLSVVIGSGVMAERLAGGNAAIALLANALATVGGLYVLIELFRPISGAHFNSAVSFAMVVRGAVAPALLFAFRCRATHRRCDRSLARPRDVRHDDPAVLDPAAQRRRAVAR